MAIEAYCVKCKAKKEMKDPVESLTKNGKPITKGKCPDWWYHDLPYRRCEITSLSLMTKRTALAVLFCIMKVFHVKQSMRIVRARNDRGG